jgi:hypothetical protein
MPETLRSRLEQAGVDSRLLDVFARNMEQAETRSEAELKALRILKGGAIVQSIRFRNWIVNWRDIVLSAIPAFTEAAIRGVAGDTIAAVLSALEGFRALA